MTNIVSGSRRHLALWFPFLAADRLEIARRESCPASPDAGRLAPIVLVEKVKGALRLAAVNRAALDLGLTHGLGLADARARVPDLKAHDHDPCADRKLLERIADGCLRYTPMVALDSPDGLLLDITGCAHLFGGEVGLAGDLEARLARFGMHIRHAFASSPDAARALARFRTAPAADEKTAIKALPVAALRLNPEGELGLRRAGLKTIGDLACRPMAALAARFGEEALTALRRMLGEAANPIAPRRLPPPVMVERRFAEPITRIDYALAVLKDLAGQAGETLEQRKKGGRRFEAVFFRSDGLARFLSIDTGRSERDPALLMRLFGERIESLTDPIDPGFGFDLIRFSVPAVEPMAPLQLRLEGGETRDTAVAALIDRLSTRMGRGRVRRFRPYDTHVPEQAQLVLPALDCEGPSSWPLPAAGEPPWRPLNLFDPPQKIDVVAEVPDGPPQRFRWNGELHAVRRTEGPERIAAEWWKRKDNKGLTRDYYRIEDDAGRRFWIFCHGLFGIEQTNPSWYLHGLFA